MADAWAGTASSLHDVPSPKGGATVPEDDENRDLPTTDHPLHGPRKPATMPIIIAIVIALVFVGLWVAGLGFLGDRM
jgi:hypothetical protein